MRLEFEADERARLARQLGVAPDDEAALTAAVQRALGPQRDPGDMNDIRAALPGDANRAERIRLMRERVNAVSARQRREYQLSDADDRLFGTEDDEWYGDAYDAGWLTAAEHAARSRIGSRIIGRQPPTPAQSQPGRVTFVGSGGTHNPTGRKGR
jgi:hypothetical protein